MSRLHTIKIDDEYMKAKLKGDKPFEVRLNDRGYMVGDKIRYVNSATNDIYPVLFVITYITDYMQDYNVIVYADKRVRRVLPTE